MDELLDTPITGSQRVTRYALIARSAMAFGCSLTIVACGVQGIAAQDGAEAIKASVQSFLAQTKVASFYRTVDPQCSALLDDLQAGSPKVRYVEPSARAEMFEPGVFGRYQAMCPGLPLNQYNYVSPGDGTVPVGAGRKEGETDDEYEQRMGLPSLGTHDAKMFEFSRPDRSRLFVFYADSYIRQAPPDEVKNKPSLAYEDLPGAEARYTFFDLAQCRTLATVTAPARKNHVTGEKLPQLSALVEYEDKILVVEMGANKSDLSNRQVTVYSYNENVARPLRLAISCRAATR